MKYILINVYIFEMYILCVNLINMLTSGYPLSDENTKQYMGYCPQTDPLLDLLNAYETLWFYG